MNSALNHKAVAAVNGGSCGQLPILVNNPYLSGALDDLNPLLTRTSNRAGCPGKVTALTVSADGNMAVGAINLRLFLWTVGTGELIRILENHRSEITCLRFSSDGSYLISGGKDSDVLVWNLGSILNADARDQIRPSDIWSDHTDDIVDIYTNQFASRSPKVVVVSRHLCTVYSLETGACLISLPSKERLYSATMDPAEFLLFVGNYLGEVMQVELNVYPEQPSEDGLVCSSESTFDIFRLQRKAVTCLATTDDGVMLLTGSRGGTIVIWSIYNQQIMQVIKQKVPVLQGFFTPNPLMKEGKLKTTKPFQFEIKSSDVEVMEVTLTPCNLKTVDSDIMGENLPKLKIDVDSGNVKDVGPLNANMSTYMWKYMAEKNFQVIVLENAPC